MSVWLLEVDNKYFMFWLNCYILILFFFYFFSALKITSSFFFEMYYQNFVII